MASVDERLARYAGAIDAVLGDEFLALAAARVAAELADDDVRAALLDAAEAIRGNERTCKVKHTCHHADAITLTVRAGGELE